jgi:hypothetical protein
MSKKIAATGCKRYSDKVSPLSHVSVVDGARSLERVISRTRRRAKSFSRSGLREGGLCRGQNEVSQHELFQNEVSPRGLEQSYNLVLAPRSGYRDRDPVFGASF